MEGACPPEGEEPAALVSGTIWNIALQLPVKQVIDEGAVLTSPVEFVVVTA